MSLIWLARALVGILILCLIGGYFVFRPTKASRDDSSKAQKISALILKSSDFQKQHKLSEAAESLDRAITLQRQFFPHEIQLEVRLLISTANLYDQTQDFEKSSNRLEEAISIQEKDGDDNAFLAGLINDLGVVRLKQQKYKEAEALFHKSMRTSSDGESDSFKAKVLNNLAGLYSEQGMYEEAEPLAKQAIDLMTEKYGDDDPAVLALQENYTELQGHLQTTAAKKPGGTTWR